MRRAALLLGMVAVLGGPPVAAAASRDGRVDWRRVATLPDRDRLRRLRAAWEEGIRLAYAKGGGPALRAEGALLDPDSAVADPIPPAGAYRCRVFKLGGVPGFSVSPTIPCRVGAAGDAFSFATAGSGQRTTGRIFADGDFRGVFLGTLTLPDEAHALPYGRDAGRDLAGVVKRIGPAQWRISVPYPRFESTLDVIELTPAP